MEDFRFWFLPALPYFIAIAAITVIGVTRGDFGISPVSSEEFEREVECHCCGS